MDLQYWSQIDKLTDWGAVHVCTGSRRSAVPKRKAVTAYFSSQQLLPFGSAEADCPPWLWWLIWYQGLCRASVWCIGQPFNQRSGLLRCGLSEYVFFFRCLNLGPVNTRFWPNACLMLVHRLRRWTSIKLALCQNFVFAGNDIQITALVNKATNRWLGQLDDIEIVETVNNLELYR